MLEDIMDKQIKNPKTGNKIKVRTALQLPGDPPANKMAKKLVAKSPAKKDEPDIDVGGPAYPNVPKGAKSSKQAKVMKQNDSVEFENKTILNPETEKWAYSVGPEMTIRGLGRNPWYNLYKNPQINCIEKFPRIGMNSVLDVLDTHKPCPVTQEMLNGFSI